MDVSQIYKWESLIEDFRHALESLPENRSLTI